MLVYIQANLLPAHIDTTLLNVIPALSGTQELVLSLVLWTVFSRLAMHYHCDFVTNLLSFPLLHLRSDFILSSGYTVLSLFNSMSWGLLRSKNASSRSLKCRRTP
jgi:hypothetical protein